MMLKAPCMEENEPGPGKRVRQVNREFAGTGHAPKMAAKNT